jgi:hypothetical protein
MREDLTKQKTKVQDMESKYKRRLTREVEKFRSEILDQIQSNINKYVDLIVKEQTSKASSNANLKPSSSPRGNGTSANGYAVKVSFVFMKLIGGAQQRGGLGVDTGDFEAEGRECSRARAAQDARRRTDFAQESAGPACGAQADDV